MVKFYRGEVQCSFAFIIDLTANESPLSPASPPMPAVMNHLSRWLRWHLQSHRSENPVLQRPWLSMPHKNLLQFQPHKLFQSQTLSNSLPNLSWFSGLPPKMPNNCQSQYANPY